MVTLNLIRIVKKSSPPESPTATLTGPQSSAICGISSVKGTPEAIRAWLMRSPAARPANPIPGPEKDSGPTTPGTCGPPSLTSYGSFDLSTCSWKTPQRSLLEGLTGGSVIFSRSGMMRNGRLFRRPTRELPTFENGCGSWLSPTVRDWKDSPGMSFGQRKNGRWRDDYLPRQVYKMTWPTPTAGDSKASGSRKHPGSKAHAGTSLTDAAVFGGGHGPRDPSNRQRLNPSWVEWLMGWPIGWSHPDPLPSLRVLSPAVDPHPQIPRTTTRGPHFRNRLKALGNGWVPDQATLAHRLLEDECQQ